MDDKGHCCMTSSFCNTYCYYYCKMKIPFDSDVFVPGASPPTDVTAVQDGPTSIRVTWTPPSPLGDTTGYRISFTGGGNSDSVNVTGSLTNSYTLTTGLQSGQTYTIFVASTFRHFPSDAISVEVTLSKQKLTWNLFG